MHDFDAYPCQEAENVFQVSNAQFAREHDQQQLITDNNIIDSSLVDEFSENEEYNFEFVTENSDYILPVTDAPFQFFNEELKLQENLDQGIDFS